MAMERVKVWQQCGGQNYTGPTVCDTGLVCKHLDPWYSQCQYDPNDPGVPVYRQCGGRHYTGPTVCVQAADCKKQNEFYSQCLPK